MTNYFLFFTLIGFSPDSFSQDFRYSISAQCYVEDSSGRNELISLGEVDGFSNKSCQEAYKNLKFDCRHKAQGKTFKVYNDVRVVERSSSSSRGRSLAKGESTGIYGLGLLGISSSKKSESSSNESQSAQYKLEYDGVVLSRDCIVDESISQSKKKTLPSSYLGG